MDDEQLKAKLGQILYNTYINDRLEEEILKKVSNCPETTKIFTTRLGRDAQGKDIYLDYALRRENPLYKVIEGAEARPEEEGSAMTKYALVILKSDKLGELENEIRSLLGRMITKALVSWSASEEPSSSSSASGWKVVDVMVVEEHSEARALQVTAANKAKASRWMTTVMKQKEQPQDIEQG